MAQQTWTDTTLSGVKIKATHAQELMDAVQAWQTAYNITNSTFSNEPVANKKINGVDATQLKSAVDSLNTLVSNSFSWSGDFSGRVDANDITDIRSAINELQADYCYQCDSPDGVTCTVCNNVCNAESCTTCDNVCNAESCTTCDNTCYSQTCSTCNNARYTLTCGCYNVCYDYGQATKCNDAGYACNTCNATCYNQGCSTCNLTCYSQTCSTCNNTCNAESCSTCDGTCYSESCTTCDGACNAEGCTKCNVAVYRYPWT